MGTFIWICTKCWLFKNQIEKETKLVPKKRKSGVTHACRSPFNDVLFYLLFSQGHYKVQYQYMSVMLDPRSIINMMKVGDIFRERYNCKQLNVFFVGSYRLKKNICVIQVRFRVCKWCTLNTLNYIIYYLSTIWF